MSITSYAILLSAIYVAPHMPPVVAIVLSIVWLAMAWRFRGDFETRL